MSSHRSSLIHVLLLALFCVAPAFAQDAFEELPVEDQAFGDALAKKSDGVSDQDKASMKLLIQALPKEAKCAKQAATVPSSITDLAAGIVQSTADKGCTKVSGTPMKGEASYYGEGDCFDAKGKGCKKHMLTTASGEKMAKDKDTAAMRVFDARKGKKGDFRAYVNCPNGETVDVVVNDWGPAAWTGRLIDLSPDAAEKCGFHKPGVYGGKANVSVQICQDDVSHLIGHKLQEKVN